MKRTSFFLSLSAQNVFVEIDGQGPYMIMTHGLGASSNVFQPLVEEFSDKYTVIRLDWPGLGKSPLPTTKQPLSVPYLIEVLEQTMDALEIPSAILVGHSLGGIISMHMAARCPQRVDGLAVIGAGRTRAV